MNWTSTWEKSKDLCSVEGCFNAVRSKGWCNKHYLRFYKRLMITILLTKALKIREVILFIFFGGNANKMVIFVKLG